MGRGALGQQDKVWLWVSLEGCPRAGVHGWPWGESILEDSSTASPATVGGVGQTGRLQPKCTEKLPRAVPGVWLPASCVLDTAWFLGSPGPLPLGSGLVALCFSVVEKEEEVGSKGAGEFGSATPLQAAPLPPILGRFKKPISLLEWTTQLLAQLRTVSP